MAGFDLRVLSDREIRDIHEAALVILQGTGVVVYHEETLGLLAESGARVDFHNRIARIPEDLVMNSVAHAGRQYTLWGRMALR